MRCPICDQKMSSILYHRPGVSIVRCLNCGFIANDLGDWHYPYAEQDYYPSIPSVDVRPDRPFIRHRIQQIQKLAVEGRYVDLGCGLGETAVAMAQAGFAAEGVEESTNAVSYLQQHYPTVVWHNQRIDHFVETMPAVSFDVITLFHVLEHIPQPRDLCVQLNRLLRVDGLLVVEVPDVTGGQARIRGWRWQHWLPHHVNYFGRNTLRSLLEPLGFELVQEEVKYHLGFPQGIWWRDVVHGTMARFGLHDIITTYWRKIA